VCGTGSTCPGLEVCLLAVTTTTLSPLGLFLTAPTVDFEHKDILVEEGAVERERVPLWSH
jgi:hypothetical protein